MRVAFSPLARQDLREITTYMKRQGEPKAAMGLARTITRACAALDNFPERYEQAPGYGRGFRRLVVGNYLVSYRVLPDKLQVVEVRDGRREPEWLER